VIKRYETYFTSLAKVESIQPFSDDIAHEPVATAVIGKLELFLPLADLVDLDKEKARLEKELERLTGLEKGLRAKLANEKFLEKAPANVVETEKQKLANIQESLYKVKANYQRFQSEA
jgi:valyl-tRNA synthetase